MLEKMPADKNFENDIHHYEDSEKPAFNFDGEQVTEESWINTKEEYLGMEIAKFDDSVEGFKEKRESYIERINQGERSQALWNSIMNLV
jgi:hypothetical protein